MTWVKKDDRFPQHRKVAPLSDAAYRHHDTAMCWAACEGTDGHIPANIPATLTRAPQGKALRKVIGELVDAGLWEQNQDGSWEIHDFLEYNPSAAEVAAKAEQASDAGRRAGKASAAKRAEQRKPNVPLNEPLNGTPTDSQRTVERRVERNANGEANGEATIFNPVPVPVPVPLVPTCKTTAEDLSGHGPPGPPPQPQPGTPVESKVPCPGAAEVLTPEQRATLETSGIPGWAIETIVADFAARYAADPNDRRTLVAWRKCASRAVSGDWNNPNRRPKKPEPGGGPPIALKGGAVQRTGESFVAKYRAEQAAKSVGGAA